MGFLLITQYSTSISPIARNLDSARRKGERYLDRFYGSKREYWVERNGNGGSYFGGEVTVKLGCVEGTTADELARRLLIA